MARAAKAATLHRMKMLSNHVDLTNKPCADTRELLREKPDKKDAWSGVKQQGLAYWAKGLKTVAI
jgi:hypothetical protein